MQGSAFRRSAGRATGTRARRAAGLIAAGLAMLGFTSTASAWAPTQRVSAPGAQVIYTGLAAGGDSATAVWIGGAGGAATVWAATRSATGGFETPIAVSPAGDADGSGLDVAIGPDGSLTVIWIAYPDGAVRVATRAAGAAAFGSPQTLSEQSPEDSRLVTAADGTTLAVWPENEGATSVVKAAIRRAGATTFGPAEAVSGPGRVVRDPEPVVAPDGSFMVVWRASVGGVRSLETSTRAAGAAAFGLVQTVSGATPDDQPPRAAVAGDGSLTVVWTEGFASGQVRSATRVAGATTFGAPETISAPAWNAGSPVVAAAPTGTVAVTWNETTPPSNRRTGIAFRPAGATAFDPTQSLTTDATGAWGSAIAAAADGRFTAAWYVGTSFAEELRTATVAPGTTTLSSSEQVEGVVAAVPPPLVAIAGDGTPTLVWNGGLPDPLVYGTWGAATTYPLSIARSGAGTGVVTSPTGGIDCGPICAATLPLSTRLTLTAKPTGGSTFAGWSGACSGTATTCVVPILGARTATARFNASRPGKVRVARSRTTRDQTEIVRWQAPGSTGGTPLLRYQTRYRTKGGAWSGWERQDLRRGRLQRRRFPGLAPGLAYAVEIRAVNRVGPGRPVLVSFVLPPAAR